MLQLLVTDDQGAVATCEFTDFPILIGRSTQAGLRVSAPGVFEEHARIRLAPAQSGPGQRFIIEAVGQALLLVNGVGVSTKQLAIGDEISLGAARLVVSLGPAQQTRLGFHETAVWSLLLLVVIVESVVIHFAR